MPEPEVLAPSPLRRLAHLTGPLAASEVLSFANSVIMTAFVGRLGTRELSAWVLAHTFMNVTGAQGLLR